MAPGDAVVMDDPDKGMPILARRPDHSCVFFGGDKKCDLHRLCGFESKPSVCRDFPYRFRKTPDGVYVGLSFVCPSVRDNKGTPVAEQEEQLARTMQSAFSLSEIEGPVLLTSHIEISWAAYVELEKHFHALLDHAELPLGIRLIACNVLINFIDAYFRQLYGEHVPMGEARPMADKELTELLRAMRQSEYADVLRVARKPVRAARIRRMFLGMITSFGNTLFHKRGRLGVITAILGQYGRHALGIGGVRLNPLHRKVSHRQLRDTRFPEEGPAAELLLRYFHHVLFRKDIVYKWEAARGLNLLLLNAALVQWYAAAEAAQNDRPTPEYADWSEGIGHVERLYGFHSKFYQFFAEHPVIDEVMESFMVRKNYPFIMLR